MNQTSNKRTNHRLTLRDFPWPTQSDRSLQLLPMPPSGCAASTVAVLLTSAVAAAAEASDVAAMVAASVSHLQRASRPVSVVRCEHVFASSDGRLRVGGRSDHPTCGCCSLLRMAVVFAAVRVW